MKYIFLFFLLIKITLGYTNIAPLYLDENIDGEGAYKEYILTNNTQKNLKYRIYVEKKENTLDMSEWTEIYPKVVSLKPGEGKRIKLFIQAPNNSPKGEYITNLCIKEVEYPQLNKNRQLQILTNLKIELAGFIGEKIGKIKIDKINKDEIMIKNIGYKREKLSIYFIEKNKNILYLGEARLFKGEKKSLKNSVFEKNGTIRIVDKNDKILLEKNFS